MSSPDMMSDNLDQLLSGLPPLAKREAVASVLSVSTRQLDRWIASGAMRSIKLTASSIRIPRDGVLEFLRARREERAASA